MRFLLALLVVGSVQTVNAEGVAIRAVHRIIHGPGPAEPFLQPLGLAIDRERQVLLIADTGSHRISLFDVTGRSRGSMSWESDEPGVASGLPRCVALNGRGHLFVLDGLTNEIEVLTGTGSRVGFLRPNLPPEAEEGVHPQFVAVGSSGRIYVLYAGKRAGFAVLEPNGATDRILGFDAPGASPFVTPLAFAVNADESRLAVVDPRAEHQVKILDADGELVTSFGPHGEGKGTFSLPSCIAWGPGETLWISDTIRHSISVFGSEGDYLGWIGGFGPGPGQLYYPSAIAFLSADRIAVLERVGARCQILDLDLDFILPDPEGAGQIATRLRSAGAQSDSEGR
jgi:DNA-binding beta-propeller fold protein YncE